MMDMWALLGGEKRGSRAARREMGGFCRTVVQHNTHGCEARTVLSTVIQYICMGLPPRARMACGATYGRAYTHTRLRPKRTPLIQYRWFLKKYEGGGGGCAFFYFANGSTDGPPQYQPFLCAFFVYAVYNFLSHHQRVTNHVIPRAKNLICPIYGPGLIFIHTGMYIFFSPL